VPYELNSCLLSILISYSRSVVKLQTSHASSQHAFKNFRPISFPQSLSQILHNEPLRTMSNNIPNSAQMFKLFPLSDYHLTFFLVPITILCLHRTFYQKDERELSENFQSSKFSLSSLIKHISYLTPPPLPCFFSSYLKRSK
jgi:hypothetical protein